VLFWFEGSCEVGMPKVEQSKANQGRDAVRCGSERRCQQNGGNTRTEGAAAAIHCVSKGKGRKRVEGVVGVVGRGGDDCLLKSWTLRS